MATQEPKQFKKITKVVSLSVFGVIGVLAIGYFGIVRPLQVRAEKKEFLASGDHIRDLQSKVTSSIGAPTQSINSNYCRYSSSKFDEGRLTCVTNASLKYEDMDSDSATRVVKKIEALLETTTHRNSGREFNSFEPVATYTANQQASQQLSNFESFSCSVGYDFPAHTVVDNPFTDTGKDSLQIYLSCSKRALAEHFPLRK